MVTRSLLGGLLLLLAPAVAFAAATAPLPEPGVLELLALGGVVAGVIAMRKRRK